MPPPPIARKPKSVKQFRALYDYQPEEQESGGYKILDFEEGDIITWIEDLDDNWIRARVNNREGIVPKDFVDSRASQVFPLHEACRRGNLDQIQEYLKNQTPVNQRDKTNGTPIFYAAAAGYLDCVNVLLATGFVDMKIKNNFLETPIHAASAKGWADVVKALYEYNQKLLDSGNPNGLADILSCQNKIGKTALDLATDPATKVYLSETSGLSERVYNSAFTANIAVSDEEDSDEEE